MTPFEQHLHQAYQEALARAEQSVAAWIAELEGGKLPPTEEIVLHGQIVSLEGWENVSFFVWKKTEACAYFVRPNDQGNGFIARCAPVPHDKWPEPLLKWAERQEPEAQQ